MGIPLYTAEGTPQGAVEPKLINLTVLNRYSRLGASSRLRTRQYKEHLEALGFSVSFADFFSDSYLQRLYSGRSILGEASVAYVRRLGQLLTAGQSNLLWIEKEAFPWLPWGIERAFLPRNIPIILDYDDAVFHRYDRHESKFVRWLLGRKIDKLMASASLITAGNRYLADRAREAGADHVEIVPTVVDIAAYSQRPSCYANHTTVIGWIGTPSTWEEYMVPMMPLLAQIAKANGARIHSVGASSEAVAHPLLDSFPWTESSEVARIHAMDIGIMPLTDTFWARGKCGYKLIQYMACGIPVIAAPVGVNTDIIEHGVNGFFASSDAEWEYGLKTLIDDPDLRARMGRAARLKVVREYSLQVWGPRLAKMLRAVTVTDQSS